METGSESEKIPLVDDTITRLQWLGKDFTEFQWIMLCAEVIISVLYFLWTEDFSFDDNSGLMDMYEMYTGVVIMMLVGFGYLMTFLKHYGLGAVGWTFLITCLGVQWSVLTLHFFNQLYKHGTSFEDWSKARITLSALIDGNLAAAAFLITFGALIGKVGPKQTCLLVLFESVFYAFNTEYLMYGYFNITDVGGTIVIHMFGAYFGLAVAWCLGVPHDKGVLDQVSSYNTDLFSLIGTAFLWIYWPSFVAAPLEQDSLQMHLALVNCVLALIGSTVATFMLSARYEQAITKTARLNPVHIQNSTLAGGVAIGTVCNLPIGPGVSLLIGIIAGMLSCTGYSFCEKPMEHKFAIHDTCGIHYLHGMPSIFGALCSVAVALYYPNTDAYNYTKDTQWYMQLTAIVTTLVIAIVTGTITGRVISRGGDSTKKTFNDSEYWDVHEETTAGEETKLAHGEYDSLTD